MDDLRQIGPAAPQSGTTVLDEPPPGHDLEEWRGERADEPSPRGGGDKTRAERSLLSRIGMRIIHRPYDWVKRPWPDDRVIQVAVTTAALVGTTFAMMLVVHFNPFNPGKDLIFDDVTPTGGDMGAHVWAPAFLRDHLLPNWQLSGWSMDWYGGLPIYRFYMVVPALAIVGLDTFLPYGVAFKLIAIFGLVTLPFCAWAFGRLARFRYPIPELFAGAAICFLLNESTTIYGGNVLATMAGEFSFSIAISLMMLGLGLLARGLEDGKGRVLAWAAVVLALACLSHGIVLIYTAVAAVVIIACRSGADLWRVLVGVMNRAARGPGPDNRGLVYTVLCAPALVGLAVVLWQLTDSFVFVVAALFLSVIAVAVLAIRVGMASLANRLFVKRLLFGLAAGGLTMLLAAFWVGPFLFDHDYMTDMKYGFQPSGPNESFWKMLFDQEPFLDILINTLAIAGLIGSIARRHVYGIAIGITGLIAVALVYLTRDSLPVIGLLWNPRILPWVYLMRYLMMMIGAVEVATVLINYFRNRPARQQLGVGANSLVAGGIGLVVLVIFLFVFQVLPGGSRIGDQYAWGPFRSNHGFPDARSDGWPAYNFRGYEGRELYPEYHDVVQTMGGLGQDPEHGCGRALWEIDNRDGVGNGKYGTTMALMLLPYWTDGCIQSMEGLYFEASGSTPYHFLTAAALSKSASNPVRQQRYTNNDAEVGVEYALSLGIKYVMVTTPEAYAEAEAQPELELVEESGPWHIYEVRDSAIVEPFDTQPVVVNGRDGDQRECFLEVGTSWFQNQGDWAAMPATAGPDSWQRIDVAIDTELMDPQGQDADGCGDPEEIHSRRINVVNPVQEIEEVDLPEVEVTNVDMEQQSVEFDVSEPGVPILVRVSYFPNWEASGAEGPYRIGPNQMVVIPTDTHVELSFERSNSDLFFYGLTVIGVGLVVFTRFKDWNFPSVTSSGPAAAAPPPPPLPSRIALPELPPPPPSSTPSPAPAPPPDTIELGPVPPGPPPAPPQ